MTCNTSLVKLIVNPTACLLLLLAFVVGCGQRDPLGRQAVSGKVALDGAALDQGTITFNPESKRGVGSGTVIKNGLYAIPAARGLPPGKYTVRMNSTAPNPAATGHLSSVPTATGNDGPGIERIPPDYNVASKIVIEVVADQSSEFNFDARSK